LRARRISQLPRIFPYLIIALFIALGVANYQFAVRALGGNDFLPGWVAAREWLSEGINPYEPSVSQTAQEMIFGRPANLENGETQALFLYPLWAMIVYVPLSLLAYPLALAIWMTLLELGLLLVVWMGTKLIRWRVSPRLLAVMMVSPILCYHGFRSIVSGQFAVIEMLLITSALLAIQSDRDVLGGALLALTLIKPQLSLLLLFFVILWSISMRRWWLLTTSLVTPLLLLGISVLVSRGWILWWLRSIVRFVEYIDVRPPIMATVGEIPRFGSWVALGLMLVLVMLMVVEWFRALGKKDHWFQWTASLTLVITSLISFRTTTANLVLLIPALLMILKVWLERKKESGIRTAWIVVGLFMAGIWLLFFLTTHGQQENVLLFLPFPLFALVGLMWSRWWITSGPGVLIETEKQAWD
jgi:hypothetical protein